MTREYKNIDAASLISGFWLWVILWMGDPDLIDALVYWLMK